MNYSHSYARELGRNRLKKAAQKVKAKNDAIMTGILVTRFKMGLISVKDLEEMALDESKAEKSSAAKRVLEALANIC